MRTFERASTSVDRVDAGAGPALRNFFSPEHERKIEQFHNLDEQYLA